MAALWVVLTVDLWVTVQQCRGLRQDRRHCRKVSWCNGKSCSGHHRRRALGCNVGIKVGTCVGVKVGPNVGVAVGTKVGLTEGTALGSNLDSLSVQVLARLSDQLLDHMLAPGLGALCGWRL